VAAVVSVGVDVGVIVVVAQREIGHEKKSFQPKNTYIFKIVF